MSQDPEAKALFEANPEDDPAAVGQLVTLFWSRGPDAVA